MWRGEDSKCADDMTRVTMATRRMGGGEWRETGDFRAVHILKGIELAGSRAAGKTDRVQWCFMEQPPREEGFG